MLRLPRAITNEVLAIELAVSDADGGTCPYVVGKSRIVEAQTILRCADDDFGFEIPSSCHEQVGVVPDATQRNNGEHRGIPIGMERIRGCWAGGWIHVVTTVKASNGAPNSDIANSSFVPTLHVSLRLITNFCCTVS